MTQSGDPLENAIAERANGILKVEWLYKMKIPTREQDNRLLQYTAATYEYRNADTGNGASAGRRTEAVLEKQLCHGIK